MLRFICRVPYYAQTYAGIICAWTPIFAYTYIMCMQLNIPTSCGCTPAQLIRPGIGWNASLYSSGDCITSRHIFCREMCLLIFHNFMLLLSQNMFRPTTSLNTSTLTHLWTHLHSYRTKQVAVILPDTFIFPPLNHWIPFFGSSSTTLSNGCSHWRYSFALSAQNTSGLLMLCL